MIQLLSYVYIDHEPDTSIMIYIDNIYVLKRVSSPIVRNFTHHLLIPYYDLIHDIHEFIEAIQLSLTTKHIKGHQHYYRPTIHLYYIVSNNNQYDMLAGYFLNG